MSIFEKESGSVLEQIRDEQICHQNRKLEIFHGSEPIVIRDKVVQSHIEWLFRRGANTDRLRRVAEIVSKDIRLQDLIHVKIQSSFSAIPDLEALEKQVAHDIFMATGTANASFGLEDIALFLSPAGKASKATNARQAAKQISRAFEESTALKFDRETLEWGQKLMTRMKGLPLEVEVEWTYHITRMQRFQMYRDRLKAIRGIAGRSRTYRSVPKNSDFPFYDAHFGSVIEPYHRWHLPGERAVYFGNDKKGIIAEILKHKGAEGLKLRTIKQVELRYRNALDLTDPINLQKLGIDEATLYGSDMSHGQVISSVAGSLGFDAIVSKSAARSSSINITILRREF